MLGYFIVFLLGSVMTWRNVALICLSVPLITVVAICFVINLNEIVCPSKFIIQQCPYRFPKLPCGCCQKIDPKMRLNRCSGYVDGFQLRMLKKNSVKCNDTTSIQVRADRVRKRNRNVNIQRQRSFKSCTNSSVSAM